MPDLRGMRYSVLLPSLLLLVATLGCEEAPQPHAVGETATAGGIAFEFDDYHIRYLELTDDSGDTLEYPDPVLVVSFTMTNTGEDDFTYTPSHRESHMSERSTPLLFPAPGTGEIDWEQFTPQRINGVHLQRGTWDQQEQSATTLSAGDSITDYFLFELPAQGEDLLMLSIPPAMHRGELPLFFRFPYEEKEPQGPAVYQVGEEIDFDGVIFTVTAVEQTYVKLTRSTSSDDDDPEEGYSADAVIKASYSITNNTEETITFDPAHGNLSGNEGVVLQSLHAQFNRIHFSSASPTGQLDRIEIEPGETVEDFAAFERLQEEANSVTFVLPASHFDRIGRVRVVFSYTPEDVEKPEELRAEDDDD